MATFLENIKGIRSKYLNRDVREDIAQALEKLKSWVIGLIHNSGSSNLIEYPSESSSFNGITYDMTDDGIHVHGTATAASWLALDWGEVKLTPGKPYIANLGKNGSGTVYLSVGYFLDAARTTHATIGGTESVLNFTCPSQYVSSRDMLYVPSGSTVDAIINPMLRLANEEDTTQPEVYTVQEISEKIHTGSIGGGRGFKVVTQASQMVDPDMIYVYNGTESGYSAGYWYYHNGSAWTMGAQFYLGRDGADGVSPTATVTRTYRGAQITVTDRNGTTTANVNDATNADQDARDSIAAEIDRATAAENALSGRIDGISIDPTWTKSLDYILAGVTFRIYTSVPLGLMFLDMFGTWTSSPDTKNTWATLGQADVLKFDDTAWPDSYKLHFQYQKDQKATLYISSDGTVKFGQTCNFSSNTDLAPTKGNSCRARVMLMLPSTIAPISS